SNAGYALALRRRDGQTTGAVCRRDHEYAAGVVKGRPPCAEESNYAEEEDGVSSRRKALGDSREERSDTDFPDFICEESMTSHKSRIVVISLAVASVLFAFAGCTRKEGTVPPGAPPQQTPPADDLAAARKSFATKLKTRGPAPQRYRKEQQPPGVQ